MVDDVFPQIPFFWLADDNFLLKRHTQRSDWLPSSIWSASTTARCCLGRISAAKMAQITSIYRISILTTTSARFHVTSLPFLNFAPGRVPPRAAGRSSPGVFQKSYFHYFFSIKISQLVSKLRCHDSIRIISDYLFFYLTVHLHNHTHTFSQIGRIRFWLVPASTHRKWLQSFKFFYLKNWKKCRSSKKT